MNINNLNTIEQMEQFLTGSQAVAFLVTSSKDECYQGIQHTLVKFDTPIIKTPINDFLTNEEVLPIIQKDALMSLVQWSQAHGQKLKPTELESSAQHLAKPSPSSKKPSHQFGSRTGSTPIDETKNIERGLS